MKNERHSHAHLGHDPPLTQHHHPGSDRHPVIEVDDVGIQHADASRGFLAPDFGWLGRAMDAVDGVDLALIEIEGAGSIGLSGPPGMPLMCLASDGFSSR